MAGSVNKVILIGNLGKDPEVRTMQSGDKVAGFSIATSESWKDKATGERKERTEWHNISIFNPNLVMVAEKYLKKGAKVYIEGQLETRKWTDKDGHDRYTTDVVLRPFRGELTMLDSKGSGGGSYGVSDGGMNQDYGGGGSQSRASSAPAPMDDMEDEIPF